MANVSEELTIPAGYKDVSIPIAEIMRSGTILSLVLLALPLVIYAIVNRSVTFIDGFAQGGLLLLLMVVAIAVHEGLHALAWMLAGDVKFNEIRFGFDARNLAPYAHARTDMTARAYRVGVLIPGIVLGVIPSVVGIATGDGLMTLFGAIMLSAAIGDMYVFWIIREVPGDAQVRDHPSQAGCMVKVDSVDVI